MICLSIHRHAPHCRQEIPASSFVLSLLPAFACTACKKFHGQTKKELRAHSSNYPLVCSLPRLLPSLAPLAFVTCPALDGAVVDAPSPCDLGGHPLPSLLQLGLVCLFLLWQRSANHFVFFACSWWCSVLHDPHLLPLWLIYFLFSRSIVVVHVCLDLPPHLLFPLLVCRS